MAKIVFLDTYYPDVFKKITTYSGYDQRVTDLADLRFGTSNYYSQAFQKMGWKAEDVVVNDPWVFGSPGMASGFIMGLNPDIVYCQDLSFLSDQEIAIMKARGIKVVAQHSCPWAGDHRISKFDIVFTSFPHYIDRIKMCGTRAEFLPIAFGEQLLNEIPVQHRDIDISFVGGVNGSSGHWSKGTQLLEEVAKAFPSSYKWWGYHVGNMENTPNLAKTYQGEAWGRDMYNILARSKIVINRHGEVAEGYSNNMRMFEVTGMGAVLCTEYSNNINSYFRGNEAITYSNISNIQYQLNILLTENIWKRYANDGQQRTLEDHTYTKRLAAIEPILRDLIK